MDRITEKKDKYDAAAASRNQLIKHPNAYAAANVAGNMLGSVGNVIRHPIDLAAQGANQLISGFNQASNAVLHPMNTIDAIVANAPQSMLANKSSAQNTMGFPQSSIREMNRVRQGINPDYSGIVQNALPSISSASNNIVNGLSNSVAPITNALTGSIQQPINNPISPVVDNKQPIATTNTLTPSVVPIPSNEVPQGQVLAPREGFTRSNAGPSNGTLSFVNTPSSHNTNSALPDFVRAIDAEKNDPTHSYTANYARDSARTNKFWRYARSGMSFQEAENAVYNDETGIKNRELLNTKKQQVIENAQNKRKLDILEKTGNSSSQLAQDMLQLNRDKFDFNKTNKELTPTAIKNIAQAKKAMAEVDKIRAQIWNIESPEKKRAANAQIDKIQWGIEQAAKIDSDPNFRTDEARAKAKQKLSEYLQGIFKYQTSPEQAATNPWFGSATPEIPAQYTTYPLNQRAQQ